MANTIFAGPLAPGNGLQTSAADGLTAHAGGGQTSALQLTAQINRVTTVGSANDSVALPVAAPIVSSRFTYGQWVTIINDTSTAMQVYGNNAAADTINDVATGTGISQPGNSVVTYYCTVAGKWYAQDADPGVFTTLNASGLATLSGGLTVSGAQTEAITVVTAAGATQGTAGAIPATAVNVRVSGATSAIGLKLPTAVTGRVVSIIPSNTVGVKVYGAAAGQLINAGTTATTAFAITSGKPTAFYAVDATHWRTANPLTSTTIGSTFKETVSVVLLAGVTQFTAGAIPATAVLVRASGASAAGCKLPTASTGRIVTVMGNVGHSFKIYTAATGQSINAATTASTAYVQATVRATTFIGVNATKWTAIKSA